MFGFFKKKTAETSLIEEMSAQQSSEVNRPELVLTLEDVSILADLLFKKNAHASLFVAQCAGFPVGPLDANRFSEYWHLVLSVSVEDCSEENKVKAAEYWIGEFISILRHSFSVSNYEAHVSRDRIDELKVGVRTSIITVPSFEALGFSNVADALLKIAMRKKQHDLETIILELKGRKDYVRSTFLPLQRSRINKYGDVDLVDEINEVDEFIDHFFDRNGFDYFYSVSPAVLILKFIESMLDDVRVVDEMPTDGIEFEHWCADKIEAQGWSVSVSKASGDQGVDVIASREGVKVAVQCKRYTNPIGNKAVQEAFTGAQNVDAGESCVLGTGGFTASAKAIAAKTGVHLLDASNIESFSNIFGFESKSIRLDDGTDMEDLDETQTQFRLDGVGGGFLGTLLRSAIKSSGSENLGLPDYVGSSVLDSVNKDTGLGVVNVNLRDLGMLLMVAAHGIKATVLIEGDDFESMKESGYYNLDALNNVFGEAVMIEDVVHIEVLKEAYSFLFSTAKSMGPLYNDFLTDKFSEILFGNLDLD